MTQLRDKTIVLQDKVNFLEQLLATLTGTVLFLIALLVPIKIRLRLLL
jgi:hypothetical protein